MTSSLAALAASQEKLPAHRSLGVLAHLLGLIALGKHQKMSLPELAEWSLNQFADRGYYEEFNVIANADGAGRCLEYFVSGRQMIYDDVSIERVSDSEVAVRSLVWFWKEPPAPFFYYDVSLDEFFEYAQLLAVKNAERMGVALRVEHKDGYEVARLAMKRSSADDSSLVKVERIVDADRVTLEKFLDDNWGSRIMVTRGVALDASKLPGFLVREGRELIGLLTYHVKDNELEIVSLDAIHKRKGAGSLLLEAAVAEASAFKYRRVWLITSNDNLDALRFYQRRGFDLARVHYGAIDEARKIKPTIPLNGDFNIPIRHEVELEQVLQEMRC